MRWSATRFAGGCAVALAVWAVTPASGSAQEPLNVTPVDAWMTAAPAAADPAPAPAPAAPAAPLGYASTATWAPAQNACPTMTARLIPYFWLPGQHGSLTVRGRTAQVDASIGKVWDVLIDDLDFAALGRVEAAYGNWGLLFDGYFVRVSPQGRIRHLDFTSAFNQTILETDVTYNLSAIPTALGLPCGTRFELLAGARYFALKAGLTLNREEGGDQTITAEGHKEWMDPLVGARLRLPVGERLTFQVRGDVGGFDLPQSSRFTWNAEALMEYRCSDHLSLMGGWRVLDIDRQRGEGRDHFGYRMQLSGPMAAMALQF